MKALQSKNLPEIISIKKITLLICFVIAVFQIRCDRDHTTPTAVFHNPLANPQNGPAAGNPDGKASVPLGAGPEDVSTPDHIIGNGTPQSCTADAFINAVAQGGKITFNCGPEPVEITLNKPAKVFNDAKPDIVIDGVGLVTLSGGGKTRILYMNTCDQNQHWTTSHCQDQETPRLSVQNITFADGNSKNESEYDGGGAIWQFLTHSLKRTRLMLMDQRSFLSQMIIPAIFVLTNRLFIITLVVPGIRCFQAYQCTAIRNMSLPIPLLNKGGAKKRVHVK